MLLVVEVLVDVVEDVEEDVVVEVLLVVEVLVDVVEDVEEVFVEPFPFSKTKAPAEARTIMITTTATMMI